jgi:hypothetical protein
MRERALRQAGARREYGKILAYTDESGNSGLHLFDAGQPTFWTGTLVTPFDVDQIHPKIIQATLDRAGVPELHGNVLGLTGIEKIGSRLRYLMVKFDLWFIFTRIEKRYLAATKFMDTVFDAGNNRAVAHHTYNTQVLRLYFTNIVTGCMTNADQEEFWAAFRANDRPRFANVMRSVLDSINRHVDDPRTKQLLNDAFQWGMQHPEELLVKMVPEDSPNLVALTLIVQRLHEMFERSGRPVTAFVHDRQNQFGKSLKFVYGLTKKFQFKQSPFAPMPTLDDLGTFECDFVERDSSSSFGLQLVDIALWLFKRQFDRPVELHGQCADLFKALVHRSHLSNFPREEMMEWLMTEGNAWMNRPITDEALERGRVLVDQLEQNRLRRMAEESD